MIKFVYFDVGGVLIKDFSETNKWAEMIGDMSIKPKDNDRFGEYFTKWEPVVCKGLELNSLLFKVSEEFGVTFSQNYDWMKDFVSRFERNDTIWPVVQEIKLSAKVGLLTNMYPRMLDAIFEKGLLDGKWEVVIDSSLVSFKKPEKEFFDIAEKRAGVSASEILFIENSKKHIDAAKKLGWRTFWYDSKNYNASSRKLLGFYNRWYL